MTELVQQRTDDDCSICCMAMATGIRYEEVEFVARGVRFGYTPEHGTLSVPHVLDELGVGSAAIIAPAISPVIEKWLVQLLHNRPAILTVESRNFAGKLHDVYWDGRQILDPSRRKAYAPDALSLEPIRVIGMFMMKAGRP